MAHEAQPDIARQIWQGEYWGPDGAVAAARRRYESSERTGPDRAAWLSTTYSALNDLRPHLRALEWEAVKRLFQVWGPWMEQVRHFYGQWDLLNTLGYSADMTETVSRSLLARSRLPFFRAHYRRAASHFAMHAYERAGGEPGGHTAVLAAITLAEVYFIEGRRGVAMNLMDEAVSLAKKITNQNQKSRAFRQLAALAYDYLRDPDDALDLLALADATSCDPDVRAKNREMRKRVDR